MPKIKIKSAYLSRFGKLEEDYLSITAAAVRALAGATDVRRVEHIFLAAYAPGPLCGIDDPFRHLTQRIQGEFPRLRATYHGIFKTGGEALHQALALAAHQSTASSGEIIVVGSEKMTHLNPAQVAGILSQRENSHERTYGATLPALSALVTRVYMRTYRVPESAFHAVAVKNHYNGSLNPNAHFQKAVTVEEVAASPLVADPLRRLHCAPVSDGAAGLLLSPSDGDVRFAGWGRGFDAPLFEERRNIGRFVATAQASADARAMAGASPADTNLVEIHDAFSPFELINLEEMGFFPLGAAWKALENGDFSLGGRLVVNGSGGMKAKGHPIGATGLSSTVEIRSQLLGNAGRRQNPNPKMGIVQSVGGVSNESYVFILKGPA
jgi:acetyl-CoA acetyltransferase